MLQAVWGAELLDWLRFWWDFVNPQEPSCSSTRMSCLPLSDDVATNIGYVSVSDSSAEQTCQQSRDELSGKSACIVVSRQSAEEMCHKQSKDELSSNSTEQGLTLFVKPLILYHIIQKRAEQNPTFLRRGLRYKIYAKQQKRIRITLSVSGNANAELQAQNIFPLYALFARSASDVLVRGHSPLFQFTQACLLTSFNESGSSNHTEATFIIPDLITLATSRACNLDLILVSCGHVRQTLNGTNRSENSSLRKLEGKCFWGKIPVSFLRSSLDNCADLILGRTLEFASTIIMSPGFIEPNILEKECRLIFCSRKFNDMCPYRLQVSIFAEEVGARDIFNSPYSLYSYNNVPSSSLNLVRLRVGNVHFNYMYNNNICKTEVTEDFICAICLMKCGNFKGLEYHLLSSHDLFKFEFELSEKEQAVNVSLKHHTRTNELFPEAVDPRHGTFSYFSKYKKRGRLVAGTEMIVSSKATEATDVVKHGQLVSLEKSPRDAQAGFEDGHLQKDNGISVPDMSVALADSVPGGSLSPPKLLQFGKARKLSIDQYDPRNRELLQKRQIFHSHTGQKMSFEEVLSNHDSEDEIDDDVVDFEERVELDAYYDIAKDEKHIMHMWNSFVRRQRVLADGHIPWACRAFSEHHGQLLVQNPCLRWCWRLVMIKLWNHNLLDARTMDACNKHIDGLKSKGLDPK